METLYLNGCPRIPVDEESKVAFNNGTFRFSSETEEPIIVERSSLTQMNGTRSNAYPSDSSFSRANMTSPTRSRRPSDGAIISKRNSVDWNSWFLAISDLFRSSLSLDLFRESLRQLLSMEAPLFHITPLLLGAKIPANISATSTPAFSLSKRRRRRLQRQGLPMHISGLPNQGQTCFLNSVLQSLASLPPFLAYLDGIVLCEQEMIDAGISMDFDPLSPVSGGTKKGTASFSRQLLDLLDDINNLEGSLEDEVEELESSSRNRRKRGHVLSPKPLLRMIGETTEQFQSQSLSSMEQQDAQELLSALLGMVIEEAQLDAFYDRRFLENVGEFPADDSEGEPSSQFDQFVSNPFLLEDEEDAIITSAMANANVSEETADRRSGDTKTLGDRSAGLSLDGEGNILLSFSGFLSKMESEQKRQTEETNGDSLEIFSAVKPSLCVQQGRQHDRRQFQEEKKQDHSDDAEIPLPSLSTPKRNFPRFSTRPRLSTSMEILKSTISAVTPSPLSGWIGSTVQCTKCKHVRPIQNSLFLDIPLVPTSVPSYIGNAYHSPSRELAPNNPSIPPCSLDDCLAEFTSVETVQGVECRFCTIHKEIQHYEEEAMMLRGAVETTERRLKNRDINGKNEGKEVDSFGHTKVLRDNLANVEHRLLHLKTMDPDLDDFPETMGVSDAVLEGASLDLFGESEVKIERCEARKCLFLTRTPSILCCHIQRRYFDPYTQRMEKCIQLVEFPEVLDVSPYCAYGPRASTPWAAGSSANGMDGGRTCSLNNSDGRMPYRLQSIIEHRGNAFGGHYVSYRRDHTGQWYLISDSSVHPVSWHDVRCSQAYLLFYEAL